jgi:hypothetical protein
MFIFRRAHFFHGFFFFILTLSLTTHPFLPHFPHLLLTCSPFPHSFAHLLLTFPSPFRSPFPHLFLTLSLTFASPCLIFASPLLHLSLAFPTFASPFPHISQATMSQPPRIFKRKSVCIVNTRFSIRSAIQYWRQSPVSEPIFRVRRNLPNRRGTPVDSKLPFPHPLNHAACQLCLLKHDSSQGLQSRAGLQTLMS